MQDFWAVNGFYLWALTTALVIIALAWLAWNTFAAQADEDPADRLDLAALGELTDRVNDLTEGAPLMRATLGRSLQYYGLQYYADAAGAQAFALVVVNARGDGFLISSSARGGLNTKSLYAWGARVPLTPEEEGAIQQAIEQRETHG